MIKWAAIGIGLALAVLGLILGAGVCLVVAFYFWVAPHLGAAAAAAVTGAALLVVALFLALASRALLRRTQRRPRRLVSELTKTIVLMARLLLLRDPKKTLLASLLAGALAEFIFGPSRKP